MKIAINAAPLLLPLTGVGNYTYHIAKELARLAPENDYSYYYGYFSKSLYTGRYKGVLNGVKEFVKKIPFGGEIARRLKHSLPSLNPESFDLYFEPNFIPLKIRARRIVVTVMDFSFKLYPQWHPKERADYFEKHFWENIGRADKIIVASEFIKEEAINKFGLPADKIKTIPLGFSKAAFRPYAPGEAAAVRKKYSLPENFILFVGSLEPRKNLLSLLKAYISLDEALRGEFKLVLAGFKGWENGEIMELLAKVKKDVVYLGYLPDAELGALYNLASLFAYPSYYEGFGLPPLEAMACGCPVVVSRAASLPEVCGDAAYYVDPLDIESIAQGILTVARDEALRKSMKAAGLERAKRFSWESSALEHLKIFKEAVDQ